MADKEESLFIAEHVKALILTALNKFNSEGKAADKLGISPPTLRRYKIQLDIIKQDDVFISTQTNKPYNFRPCTGKRLSA